MRNPSHEKMSQLLGRCDKYQDEKNGEWYCIGHGGPRVHAFPNEELCEYAYDSVEHIYAAYADVNGVPRRTVFPLNRREVAEVIAIALDGPATLDEWSQDYQDEIFDAADAVVELLHEKEFPTKYDYQVAVAQGLDNTDITGRDVDDIGRGYVREMSRVALALSLFMRSKRS